MFVPENVIRETVRRGKCPFREFSFRGTVPRRAVLWGNVFVEVSIGEKSAGEMSVEELSSNRFQYFLEG